MLTFGLASERTHLDECRRQIGIVAEGELLQVDQARQVPQSPSRGIGGAHVEPSEARRQQGKTWTRAQASIISLPLPHRQRGSAAPRSLTLV